MATATEPGSPAIDTSQSHRAARPAPPCANARSPTTVPAPSSRQAWCFAEPQSMPANQRIVSSAGTVNLIGSGRDTAHEGRSHERLCPSGHAGDLSPGLEGLGSGGSILGGGAVIAAEVEQVVDLVVGGEEALGLAR